MITIVYNLVCVKVGHLPKSVHVISQLAKVMYFDLDPNNKMSLSLKCLKTIPMSVNTILFFQEKISTIRKNINLDIYFFSILSALCSIISN